MKMSRFLETAACARHIPNVARLATPAIALGMLAMVLAAPGCGRPASEIRSDAAPTLVGAWRSTIQFESGAFAGIRDLEFLYVFNLGGTMTESSNYDGAPPVPPAYGIWRAVGPREFESKYEFYVTKAPSDLSDLMRGGGWLPSGRGRFVEKIHVAADGRTFTSRIQYEALDAAGKPIVGGGAADGHGSRMTF